jgi:hypothetical protein
MLPWEEAGPGVAVAANQRVFWKAAAAYSCDLEYDGTRPALEGLLAVAVVWCYSLCAVLDFRLSDFLHS